jgi:FKBP-type peptidyl-prolyl cis-trans isomerase FkpA
MLQPTLTRLALLAIGAGLIFSCDKMPGNKKSTDTGLEYEFVEDKDGPVAKVGDFITLHLTYKTEKDSILGSTYKMGKPITSKVMPPSMKGSFEEALVMMSEGDSANFWVPTDSLFKGQQPSERPKFLPPGSKLLYCVRVTKVENAASVEANQSKAIEAYISSKGLKAEKTASGLYVSVATPGTGPKAAAGDTISVHYSGKTLSDGKEFDNSYQRNQPFSFPVGQGAVIPGWDEAMQMLAKGTKATLVIPSKLGYGEGGMPGSPIGPNAVLVFDVEVMDVKPAKK